MQDRQALTAQQAALRLGKQPRTVYELMQKGRLGCVRRGRRVYTTEEAVAAFARSELVLAGGPAGPALQEPSGAPGAPVAPERLPAHLREGWWGIHREGLRLPPDVQALPPAALPAPPGGGVGGGLARPSDSSRSPSCADSSGVIHGAWRWRQISRVAAA